MKYKTLTRCKSCGAKVFVEWGGAIEEHKCEDPERLCENSNTAALTRIRRGDVYADDQPNQTVQPAIRDKEQTDD